MNCLVLLLLLSSAAVPVGKAEALDVTIDDFDYEAVYEGPWDGGYPRLAGTRNIPDVFIGPGIHFTKTSVEGKNEGATKGEWARFQPSLPRAGKYEVCVGYRPGTHWASAVPVTVRGGATEAKLTLDQKKVTENHFPWISLGTFQFPAGKISTVELDATGANGRICVDGVRWIWRGE